ncbi:hypothetical protein Q1695_009705 [Nippostrongylus brasiliensis]|nr:hypothetical protein Q1695_009705 [Nippostrongylus brasiliensis]
MVMMKMYFHFRIQEPILFREWVAKDLTGYIFTCIGVAAIAMIYEIVKFGRMRVDKMVNEQHLCGCDLDTAALHGSSSVPGMPCGVTSENRKTELPFLLSNLKRHTHLLSSIIYFVQMFIAYTLMMITMTYNVPVFLSLILGHIVIFFFLAPLISIQEYDKVGDCCA